MSSHTLEYLKKLVAVGSFTATEHEKAAAECLVRILSDMPYFQANPQLFGAEPIANDHLGRDTVFALVKGKSNKTLVLMGHYDIVGIEDYGHLASIAFDTDALPAKLAELPLNADARADLESGEWLFGRGVADMKGGVAAFLDYIREYSENPNGGNVLFLGVADEESYSAGMRGAVPLLARLKEEYGLCYELCIDSEPSNRLGKQTSLLPIGTAGKTLPVVLVQGEKAHIGMCFDGLNPIGIMSEIFLNTELNLDFSDKAHGMATMPPTWNFFKDLKQSYDVSIPQRTAGYFSVLSYTSTPDEIIERLRGIAENAFTRYVDKMKAVHENYRALRVDTITKRIGYRTQVMTFAELMDYCAEHKELGDFEAFYTENYARVAAKLQANAINFPSATIEIMNAVLDFSQILQPIVIIGYAPPYYAPMNSRNLTGFEGKAQRYLDCIKQASLEQFEIDVKADEYFMALSDCSYCAIDRVFDYNAFARNTPMWGKQYSIDFDAIAAITMPCMIMGPWGKDYHQITERVELHDLTVRTPAMLRAVAENIFQEE